MSYSSNKNIFILSNRSNTHCKPEDRESLNQTMGILCKESDSGDKQLIWCLQQINCRGKIKMEGLSRLKILKTYINEL